MRESNFDVFDPSTVVMDYESSSEDGCDHGDFGFAFNDPIFSDRLLHILIMFSERFGSTQSPSVKLKTLHISSPILAARSSFFFKFFTNRTSDSQQRSVTLRINASEEAAFMELLKFMYSNNLTVTTAPALLFVLTVADKFEVASCIRHCSRLLRNLPMTPESVLIYLDLPSTVITSKAFEPLTVATKQFYAVHFKDITKFKDEILGLPLAGVEAIIASDDLQVASEDAVYRFVLKWAQAQYSNETERCEIIRTRLAKYIRYPYMTRRKLLKLLTSKEFDPGFAQKVVTEAISFKAEVPDKQQTYIRDEKSVLNCWFVERAYKYRPIKMVEFEHPRPHCVVYLDLKHDVCARLFPSSTVMSEAFYLGGHKGQAFSLLAQCNMDSFGLYLGMKEMETGSFEFDYEFAARSKLAEEFVSKLKRNYTFKDRKAIGLRNMFAISWRSFISEDSVYFIDGVLHLRVELTELIK